MKIAYIYLTLCVFGTLLPLSQFFPFFLENGPDLPLFISDVFANKASSGIAFDAIITGLAITSFIIVEGKRMKMRAVWLPIVSIFAVGMSLGLPLFLYMRENAKGRNANLASG